MTLGVTNIDMTAAYAAIANHGTYTKPVYYTAVYDYKGNLLLDNSSSETHTVLKEQTAWLLTSALESVITQGTGTSAALSNQPVAGKQVRPIMKPINGSVVYTVLYGFYLAGL